MRCRLTLAVAAAFVGGFSIGAYAQVAPGAPVSRAFSIEAPLAVTRGGGVAGTGIGRGAGAEGRRVPLIVGTGHIGAGTGGTGLGVGNATGGINGTPRAGTGGILDTTSFGLNTGGVAGSGRGFSAGTGGINDRDNFGRNTGGISDGSITAIGAGSGGRGDLNSLGAGTGGFNEQNTPRFRQVQ